MFSVLPLDFVQICEAVHAYTIKLILRIEYIPAFFNSWALVQRNLVCICFLCCIMWMTHNGAFIIHPLSTLICFLKQRNNMIWTWLSTLILTLRNQILLWPSARRYESGVNQLCSSLEEMLMQVTLHQHRLEGQVLKPVRLWILEFLDLQLGMLVFAFQKQSRRSERAHYDSWASLKYFRLGLLNH